VHRYSYALFDLSAIRLTRTNRTIQESFEEVGGKRVRGTFVQLQLNAALRFLANSASARVNVTLRELPGAHVQTKPCLELAGTALNSRKVTRLVAPGDMTTAPRYSAEWANATRTPSEHLEKIKCDELPGRDGELVLELSQCATDLSGVSAGPRTRRTFASRAARCR